MANLNTTDILFMNARHFRGFKGLMEKSYNLTIKRQEYTPYPSFTSRKVIIHTDKGAFFVKEKPLYCDSEYSRRLSADFQNFLSQKLIFIPGVIPTCNNQYYVKFQSRHYFLTIYKPGRIFNGSLDDTKQLCSALLKFQSVAKKFDFQKKGYKKSESYHVLDVSHLIKRYCKNDIDHCVFLKIEKIIRELTKKYKKNHNKSYIVSHGDFAPFNVIFTGQKVAAINDFDNTNILPRTHDMAELLVTSSLINYIAPVTNCRKPVFIKPTKKTFEAILKFYKKNFSLSKGEILLFPTLVKIVWLEILLLTVVKEDYSLQDLKKVLPSLISDELDHLIYSLL